MHQPPPVQKWQECLVATHNVSTLDMPAPVAPAKAACATRTKTGQLGWDHPLPSGKDSFLQQVPAQQQIDGQPSKRC